MSTELLLLDLDNTVYPYKECHREGQKKAWKKAKELGYSFSLEEFRELYRDGRRKTKKEIEGTASSHNRYIYFKKALRSYDNYRQTHPLKIGDRYWKAYMDEMELFPGVENTLERIKSRGTDIVVITDQLVRTQMEKIEKLGIESLIDRVVTSEEVGREKPASVMFTLPLCLMDAKKGKTVVIGDNISADISGGNSLGIETVLFNESFDRGEHTNWQEPDHKIEEFRELLEIVED